MPTRRKFITSPARIAPPSRAARTWKASKARNLEVLFCYEAVDEYVMNHLREFDGKKLIAADHGDVKLADVPQSRGFALPLDDTKKLTEWLQDHAR